MGSEALKKRHKEEEGKNRHNPRDSDHLLSRSNGKKKDKTKKLQREWGRSSSPSSCECLSSRKKTPKKQHIVQMMRQAGVEVVVEFEEGGGEGV